MFRYSIFFLSFFCFHLLKINCSFIDGLVNIFDQTETALFHPNIGQRLLIPINLSNITDIISAHEFIFDQNPTHRQGIHELKRILQGLRIAIKN